ncbi:hypothetical protein PO909_016753 [Leuciscus waleckii]
MPNFKHHCFFMNPIDLIFFPLQVELLWCHRRWLCCSGFSSEIKPETTESVWE